jgi:hypothetical protein
MILTAIATALILTPVDPPNPALTPDSRGGNETAIPGDALVKLDGENYRQGPYLAFASDWSVSTGKLALRRGVDYRDRIIVRPARFPADTRIQWRWPQTHAKTGVYGYNHLAWGYYAGGRTDEAITPARVAEIEELMTAFDVEVRAESGEFNVLSETFLTTRQRDYSTRTVEVGFLSQASASARRFFDAATPLGVWKDPDGQIWRVARRDAYCMFIPETGALWRGRLHYSAAFRWLIARNVLTGREWFNGLAIGVEPVSGAGSMTVKQWRVAYRHGPAQK